MEQDNIIDFTIEEKYDPSQYYVDNLDYSDQDKIIKCLSDIGGNAVSLAMSELSVHGLLKCNVPIDILTNAKDGGLLGTVIKDGRITEQARFEPAKWSNAGPQMFFQLLSIATGQYYMHEITKRLDSLSEGINFLEENEKSKWLAEIQSASDSIRKYSTQKSFLYEDFVSVRLQRDSMEKLFRSWKIQLERKENTNASNYVEYLQKVDSYIQYAQLSITGAFVLCELTKCLLNMYSLSHDRIEEGYYEDYLRFYSEIPDLTQKLHVKLSEAKEILSGKKHCDKLINTINGLLERVKKLGEYSKGNIYVTKNEKGRLLLLRKVLIESGSMF